MGQLSWGSWNEPRQIPAYGMTEAARILSVHPQTLRSWFVGRNPVLTLSDPMGARLSFFNLVEAHVIHVIRAKHGVRMPKIRTSIAYIQSTMQSPHPLVLEDFLTNGVDLFLEKTSQILNVSRGGQLALRDLIRGQLTRIEYDEERMAARFFPFARAAKDPSAPRLISIDPRHGFGRPVVSGTNIPTFVLAERFKAGESHGQLAEDYGIEIEKVEEALRYELRLSEAA